MKSMNDNLFLHPIVYLKDFVDHYGTKKNYDKVMYEHKDRMKIKKVEDGISTLSNIITEDNMRIDNAKYITFLSLSMKTKPFIDFLTGLVKSFSLSALDDVSIFNFTF